MWVNSGLALDILPACHLLSLVLVRGHVAAACNVTHGTGVCSVASCSDASTKPCAEFGLSQLGPNWMDWQVPAIWTFVLETLGLTILVLTYAYALHAV